jgi:serine/threonine-protein kinase
MPQAIALFEQAQQVDPHFALAVAMLGYAHMNMYFYAPDHTETRLAAARMAIDRALALQPALGEAHFALALYHYWGHRDYAAATEQLRVAQQTLPNSADTASILAAVARRQGRWNEAIAGFQRAALFDPRSSSPLDQLGLTYAALRRYADADQAFSRSVSVAPDPADERVTHAINTVRWKGDPGPLREALLALTPDTDAYIGNAVSFYQDRLWARDYAAAVKVAESDRAGAWLDQANIGLPRELYLAWASQMSGENGKAGEAFSRVKTSVTEALAQRPDAAELHLALGLADAGLGVKDDALREGRRAAELLPPGRDNISGSGMLVWLAQIELSVGEQHAAFDHLREALALPSGGSISAAVLRLDPAWDRLRKDPRFDALLKQGESEVMVTPHG